jgi:hypothetical protein
MMLIDTAPSELGSRQIGASYLKINQEIATIEIGFKGQFAPQQS